MSTVSAITSIADLVVASWCVAGLVLSLSKFVGIAGDRAGVRLARWVWAELRPLYLPAVAVIIAGYVMTGEMLGWHTFFSACSILNWFFYKDIDDDDRWKRRKAKLLARVTRRGGRLVAVPASGGAA